jgi:integrase
MLYEHNFIDLFQKFIKASETGKRVKKTGHKINANTIRNYYNTLRLLNEFVIKKGCDLILYEIKGNNKREFNYVKKYSATFYNKFCSYLFDNLSVLNNYAGQNIKIIRIFYNWVLFEKGINTGYFHKNFYVLHEEPPILTLSIEQLNFLIYDKSFNQKLKLHLNKAKDIFIVGCLTGLRISDLKRLKRQHLIHRDGNSYLNIATQKTGYDSIVKLPEFCVVILSKYKGRQKQLLPVPITCRFNKYLKQIGELAGWTWPIVKQRRSGNKIVELKTSQNKPFRFCDSISSHTMRRTCITNMLIAGMPEHIARKVSGHSSNSKSFYRYVSLAQKITDSEIEKVFCRLKPTENFVEEVV